MFNSFRASHLRVLVLVVGLTVWLAAQALAPLAATVYSKSMPTSMVAGQTYSVSVSMKNTGTETWSSGTYDHLGSVNESATWGVVRVNLPSDIPPGSIASFQFTVTAPKTAGSYTMSYQMVRDDGGAAWFGSAATQTITVTANAAPVASLSAPSNNSTFIASASGVYSLAISGSGTDSDGSVTNTALYVDGNVVGSSNGASASTTSNVGVGTHTVMVVVTDNGGRTGSASSNITVVANSPPSAAISSPANGSTFTASSAGGTYSLSISGSASDSDGSVSSTKILVDGTQIASSPGGAVSATVGLGIGSHAITVTATDNNGGTGSATANVTVVAPNVPPTASVSSPANGSTYTATSSGTYNLSITGTGSDNDGSVSQTAISVDGVQLTSVAASSVSGTANLSVGSHTITVTATDNKGATGSASVGVTIIAANVPPTASVSSPANGSTFTASSAGSYSLSITGSGSDSDGSVTQTTISVDGVEVASVASSSVTGTASLSVGTHTITVTAADNRGGTGSASVSVTVIAANVLPTASVTSPANGSTFTATSAGTYSLAITGSGSDTDGTVAQTAISVDGTQVSSAAASSVSGTASLAVGTHTVTATAVDNRGGTGSASVSVTVIAANVPPTASVSSPANGSTFTATSAGTYSLSITGNGSDSDGSVSQTTISVDGVQIASTATSSATGTASLSVGTHTITVMATDNRGGTGSASISVTVIGENIPPTASVSSPTNGSTYTATSSGTYSLAITGTGADSDGSVTQTAIAVDGVQVTSAGASSVSGTASLSVGTHTITIIATDNRGGTGSASVSVTVLAPNVPPTANVSSPANGSTFTATAAGTYSLSITGSGSDSDGSVSNTTIFVDGAQLTSAASSSVSGTTNLSVGTHTITITATDNRGGTGSASATVTVVAPNILPTAIVSSPANGSTFTEGGLGTYSLTITGSGSDSDGSVTQTTISVDGVQVTSEASGSVSGTASLSVGTHTITVTATDNRGGTGSAAVTVTVMNGVASDPTPVPINIDVPYLGNAIAGTLAGHLGVSDSGSATYSIPIAVPPGTNGMVPSIQLNYNSDNTTGSAGLGWSVGGISNIDRCGTTVATEGAAGAVRTNDDDRLCLDGEHLVLVAGSGYWADDAEYRTEVESFRRITAQRDATGYRTFKVETKGGRIEYYGETENSRQVNLTSTATLKPVHRWRLTRVTDRVGNYMSYSYLNDTTTGENKPDAIRWGGNTVANSAHYAKLSFVYESRPDVRLAYVAGSPNLETLRLKQIVTATDTDFAGNGGLTAQVTTLTYTQSPTSNRSLVQSIQVCDGASVCLPATTFAWGKPKVDAVHGFVPLGGTNGERDGPNLYALAGDSVTGGGYVKSAMESVVIADFNGDGKADILERYRVAANGWEQTLYISDASGTGFVTSKPLSGISGSLSVMEIGDFDGDGRMDILVADWAGLGKTSYNWRICKGSGSSTPVFTCGAMLTLPPEASDSTAATPRIVRDFDADGRTDIFFNGGDPDPNYGAPPGPRSMCLSNGSGFVCQSANNKSFDLANTGDGAYLVGHDSADIDGDGRVEDVRLGRCKRISDGLTGYYWSCGQYSDTSLGAIHVVSNADPNGYRQYAWWLPFTKTNQVIVPPAESGTVSGDLSADGYTDMVLGSAQASSLGRLYAPWGSVCYGKGSDKAYCQTLPASDTPALDHLIMTLGDFDGDGLYDVLRPATDTFDNGDVQSYRLCKVRPAGASGLTHTCQAWSGPTFRGESLSVRLSTEPDIAYRGYESPRSGFFGDFDGDGRTDLVTYMGRDYASGGKWQVWTSPHQEEAGQALDKISSVTNGAGLVESVGFATPSDPTVYLGDGTGIDGQALKSGYPIRRIPNTRQLVSKLTRSNGATGQSVLTYQYAGYATDARGRGNLGFAMLKVHDDTSNVDTTTWSSQEFPWIGMMTDRLVLHGSVQLERTKVTLNAATKAVNANIADIYPYAETSYTTRADPNGTPLGETTTTYGYDAWMNASSVQTEARLGAQDFISTVTSVFNNDTPSWLLGLPASVTTTKKVDATPLTRKVDYNYDDKGQLRTETLEQGTPLEVKKTYDRTTNAFGLVGKATLQWTDPVTAALRTRTVSTVAYDSVGRFPTTVLNALNQSASQTFDTRTGAPSRATGINGLSTTYKVDGFGRKTGEMAPDGIELSTLEFVCDSTCPSGATSVLVRRTLSGNSLTSAPVLAFRDSAGHVLRTQTWGFDGSLVYADVRYDSAGREYEVDQPRYGAASAVLAKRTEYDDLGRVINVTQLDEQGIEQVWSTSYDGWSTAYSQPAKGPSGVRLSRTDNKDVWGRLLTAVDTLGYTTAYTHDAFGNLTSTTDAKGNVVTVRYDSRGHRTQLIDPDLGTITYTVDALGQVLTQVNPMQARQGRSTTFTYDDLGRMTNRTEPDLISNWIFDNGTCTSAGSHSCGQLLEANTMAGTSKDYVRTHGYDDTGRLKSTTITLDTVYTSRTDYDAWGRLLRQSHQRGSGQAKAYDYRYNAYGFLARLERGALVLWQATAQDAASRVTTASLGNGLNVTRSYSTFTGRLGNGSLATSNNAAVVTEGYLYDALGNVSQRSVFWDNGAQFTESFTYDDLNRLRTSTLGSSSSTFTYDAIGNIVSKTGVGTGNYAYKPSGAGSVRPHAVDNIPGIGSFTYDDDGNLTSGAGRTATWTSFDMPLTIVKETQSSTFKYGSEHQRTRQDQNKNGVSAITYYAGAMEVEVSGATTKVKTYWPSALGFESEDAAGAGLSLNWTHLDRLGSMIAITGQNGAVQERLAYDSWGKRRNLSDTATPDSLDGSKDNKGYTGHEMLDALDLVHMNGRVYDPLLARFLSADPVIQEPEHSQSYNRYTYVWNNPTNATDPTGFVGESPFAAADGTCDARCQQLQKEADEMANNCQGNCSYFGPGRTDQQKRGNDNSGGAGNASSSAAQAAQDAALAAKGINCTKCGWQNMPDSNSEVNCDSGLCGWNDPNPFATQMNVPIIEAGNVMRETAYWELGGAIGGRAIGGLWNWGRNTWKASRAVKAISNPVPLRAARVVPADFVNGARLSAPGASEAWITAAEDLAGISNSTELARRLTLVDNMGNLLPGPYAVIEFELPAAGVASPILRVNPGFVSPGTGLTAGGAREFVVPNYLIESLQGVTTRIVK